MRFPDVRSFGGAYVCACIWNTYHTDVEGVEEVEGQSSDQVHKEPGCGVVDADGAGVVHHLAGGAHIGGSEVQHDICQALHRPIRHTHTHTSATRMYESSVWVEPSSLD